MAEPNAPDRVILTAPLTGILVPIEAVPDPVFAKKMVEKGISMDPLSNLSPLRVHQAAMEAAARTVRVRLPSGLPGRFPKASTRRITSVSLSA